MRRLARGEQLVIATHNRGKLAELAELLAPHGVSCVSAGELGLPEPDETENSFTGNARLKALAAARAAQLPALADDSGFCVAALEGAPGIYSARWAGPAKDFTMAMARVRDAVGDSTEKRAWFVCALCLAWPDGETASFLGRVEGELAWPPRGERGFGYDPIFVPLGETRSYAETAPAEKHASSHRGRAMAQFLAACLAGK